MYRTGKTYWKILQLIQIFGKYFVFPFFHLISLLLCCFSRFISLLSCTDLCFCFCFFFRSEFLIVIFSEVNYICLCLCVYMYLYLRAWISRGWWVGCLDWLLLLYFCYLLFYFVCTSIRIYTHTRMSMDLQFMVKSYPFLF